jgi:hypothetical protein
MRADIATQIEHEVAAWDGGSVEPHRFGGIEFKVGRERRRQHAVGLQATNAPDDPSLSNFDKSSVAKNRAAYGDAVQSRSRVGSR